jgi:hypothetical protein
MVLRLGKTPCIGPAFGCRRASSDTCRARSPARALPDGRARERICARASARRMKNSRMRSCSFMPPRSPIWFDGVRPRFVGQSHATIHPATIRSMIATMARTRSIQSGRYRNARGPSYNFRIMLLAHALQAAATGRRLQRTLSASKSRAWATPGTAESNRSKG